MAAEQADGAVGQRFADAAVDLMRAGLAVGQAGEVREHLAQRAGLRDVKVLIPQRVGRQKRAVAVDHGRHIRPRLIDGLMQQILARAPAAAADLLARGVHDADILFFQQELHPAGGRDVGQPGLPVDDGGVALQRGDEALLLQNVGKIGELLCIVHDKGLLFVRLSVF